jgi:hypothetical protein
MIVSKGGVSMAECKTEAIPFPSVTEKFYMQGMMKIRLKMDDDTELSFWVRKRQTKKLNQMFKSMSKGKQFVIDINIREDK